MALRCLAFVLAAPCATSFTHPCRFCPPEQEWHPEGEGNPRKLQDEEGRLTVLLQGVQTRRLEAWGTSLCWWANGVGAWRDQRKLDELLDLFFSNFTAEDVHNIVISGMGLPKSLGLTFVRYNIGGGENPDHLDFMRPGAAVEGYLRANGTWDWGADSTQRTVLAGALKRGVQRVHAFSNSPPFWMTYSGSATGGDRGSSNLRQRHYDSFAYYLATVVQRFAIYPEMLHGRTLVFDAVTPINEPNSNWWRYGNNQEGCHFSPEQQSRILRKLKGQLKAMGLKKTQLSAAEENWVDGTNESLQSYTQGAIRDLQVVTTHTYGASGWARPALAQWAAQNERPLWNTEFGTGSGPLQGGLKLASRIVDDLIWMNCSIWTLWQVADLDNSLGPNGWGLTATSYGSKAADYRIRKQYYAFKQFTAFIRPGSKILEVRSTSPSVKALAAVLPVDKPLLVVVLVNSGSDSVTLPLGLDVADVYSLAGAAAFLTDAEHDCEKVAAPKLDQDRVEVVSPGTSVLTLLIDLTPRYTWLV